MDATPTIEAVEEQVAVAQLVHDVPVDEAHVELLMESIKQMGQLAPLLVRLETYELIDGFHRAEALKRLGYETALCRVVSCSDEAFEDARITSAVLHKSVDFARVAMWVMKAWERTLWHDRFYEDDVLNTIVAYQKYKETETDKDHAVFSARAQILIDAGAVNNEINEMCWWFFDKQAIWGLSFDRIAEIISTAVYLDDSIISIVRQERDKEAGLIDEATVKVVAARVRSEEYQQAIIEKALGEDLPAKEVTKLLDTMSSASNGETAQTIFERPWRETQQKRAEEELAKWEEGRRQREEYNSRPEVIAARKRDWEEGQIIKFIKQIDLDRRKINEMPVRKYPDLKKRFDAALSSFVAAALRYRGDSLDRVTELEQENVRLRAENAELRKRVEQFQETAGIARQINAQDYELAQLSAR